MMRMFLSLLLIVPLMMSWNASAETDEADVEVVDVTKTESEDSSDKDKELSATFGSQATSGLAGCKTEELKKKILKDLEDDCNAWLRDLKADKKFKDLRGNCKDVQCSDCSMPGLQRCKILGKAVYK